MMMPTVIELRFPARHYHATPWSHHVNEGLIEWPPSPWRILRAFLSVGFTKLGWPAEGPPDDARGLIEALASKPPSFARTRVTTAHTRHYVDADQKRPLIFDVWAQVPAGEVLEIVWPVELTSAQRALLSAIACNLGYLGRAESWVDARLVAEMTRSVDCVPAEEGPPGPGFESIRVMCPVAADDYARWRASRIAAIEADYPTEPGKRRKAADQRKLDAAVAPYPRDLLSALCTETARLQAEGWSAPPGSREVTYWQRRDGVVIGPPRAPARASAPAADFVLLAISTASRGTSALPPLERVFPQGRLLHRALASVIGYQMDGDEALALELLGRATDGHATHDHRHAHLLYLDLDGDQRLDHVLVYRPGGLSARACEAFRRLRKTYMKGGVGELQVSVAAVGDEAVLRGLGASIGDALHAVLGPTGGATEWCSATPWVPPRNLKPSGKNTLEGVLQMEVTGRGLPRIVSVSPMAPEALRAVRHFVLHDDRLTPPKTLRLPLRIRFETPVIGPVCLGYGAHFGLGRFTVAEAPSPFLGP
jgi:CRISPR-associated protein Csb2